MENENMSNAQFDSFLENLARLIEAQATTPQEAAELVRDSKTNKIGSPPTKAMGA